MADLWNLSMEKRLNDIKVEKEEEPSLLDSTESLPIPIKSSRTREHEPDTNNNIKKLQPQEPQETDFFLGIADEPDYDDIDSFRALRKGSVGSPSDRPWLIPGWNGTSWEEESNASPQIRTRSRSYSDPRLSQPVGPVGMHATKQMLDSKKKNEQFQALFNLPRDEVREKAFLIPIPNSQDRKSVV